jgi:hypothetical protein
VPKFSKIPVRQSIELFNDNGHAKKRRRIRAKLFGTNTTGKGVMTGIVPVPTHNMRIPSKKGSLLANQRPEQNPEAFIQHPDAMVILTKDVCKKGAYDFEFTGRNGTMRSNHNYIKLHWLYNEIISKSTTSGDLHVRYHSLQHGFR